MRAALTTIVTAVLLVFPGVFAASAAPSAQPRDAQREVQTEVRPATDDDAGSDAEADTEADPDANREGDDQAETTITLSAVAESASMTESGDHTFLVEVANLGDDPLPAGSVQVRILTDPVTKLDEITGDTVTTEPAGLAVATIETPIIAAGERFASKATPASSSFALNAESAAGVYQTQVSWTEAAENSPSDGQPTESITRTQPGTPFVWNASSIEARLNLATIVPLVYPETDTPPVTPAEVDLALGDHRSIERLLDAAETAGSLVAVDPRVVGYVRSLGASASPATRELVDRITSQSLATAALGYADADPVATALLMPDGALEPTGLSFLARHFTELTEQAESDSAHKSHDHSIASLTDGSMPPVLEELVTWDTAIDGFAWPSAASLSTKAIEALVAQGLTNIVVNGEDAAGAARGTLGGATLYRSEAALEETARAFLAAESDIDSAEAAALLASVTAVLGSSAQEGKAAEALLAVDRGTAAGGESLEALFTEMSRLPWVSMTPVENLTPGTVTLTGEADVQKALDQMAEAVRSEERVVEYSRVLAEPQLLVDYQRDRLASTLAVRGPLSGSEPAQDALENRIGVHLAGNERLQQGVRIVDTEHTRLLGSTSNLPIQLRNTLPFDARVAGTVSTGSAALIVQKPKLEPTVIPAESTINHLVPVKSRASSGQVDLKVQLRDTTKGEDIASTTFEVTLSGQTETIALTTLGVIVVALFVGGLWRSITRKRSTPSDEPLEPAAATASAEPAEPAEPQADAER
ncbi:hypothetical protein JSO19_06570 [Leucobacter sp. UCMA 4100]|uniref:DUF6049 family protein n=1 Tax=Leucobacter sp. UCMA 4100 TaxID=2810534 RepID=UPI0022EB2BFD|nr:DUF6049 family protein [Leucobacter sp. UCMA 4100]MDA3147042.1 hypothetical protein [Leucobacter sp. UCMA 4100]